MKIKTTDSFGWSGLAWHHTMWKSKLINQIIKRKRMKILELGAGPFSQVAFEFDTTSSEITIGIHSPSDVEKIRDKIMRMKSIYPLKSKYNVSQIDAFAVEKKYDVIIMKSVLGGIFRDDISSVDDFCCSLANNNLNKGGILITVDNGRSVFEPFLQYYGARKNNWHYMRMGELAGAQEQVAFGFFSCFALSNRLSVLGWSVEVFLYLLDWGINLIIRFNPTVICSVYQAIKK
ncbi:hypothetical protein N9P76_02400 [Amylibacter sp.]|nr:hypothetical protein [Amylibacter sp.]